jgi:hypothetical protein
MYQTIDLKDMEKLIKISPLYLNGELAKDITIFRKILEISMKNCLWNGFCGQS